LHVRTQLKHVFTNSTEIPLAVEGLRARVPLPNAEPERFVPSVACVIYARTHQCLTNAASEPFLRHVKPDQFDRLRSFNVLWRLTRLKFCVSGGLAVHLCDQESRSRMGELCSLLCDAEV